MKRRDLKKKIREAYEAEKPSLREDILAACAGEPQLPADPPETAPSRTPGRRTGFRPAVRRAAACAVCLVLFVLGVSVGRLLPSLDRPASSGQAETVVYLDVNPSVELQMNRENKVVACIAGNEDAELILSGLQLTGVDMNTALTAIVGSMYVNGYLSEDSNSILVSVEQKDGEVPDTLLSDITGKINTVFEKPGLACSIIAQSVQADETLRQKAQENGVSVGKMYLVEKMIGCMDDLRDEDAPQLADLSIKELNLIYSRKPEKEDGNPLFDRDVSTGEVGGYIRQSEALATLLSAIGVNGTDVEWSDVKVKIRHESGMLRMVYGVSIRLRGETAVRKFELDCLSGEVTERAEEDKKDKEESGMPDFDFPRFDSFQ